MKTATLKDVLKAMTQAQEAAFWDAHTLEIEAREDAPSTPLADRVRTASHKARVELQAQRKAVSSSGKNKRVA